MPGRAAVGPADAGQYFADVALGPVEGEAVLAEGPAQPGQAALDGGRRPAPPGAGFGGEVGEVEADRLGRGRQRLKAAAGAPRGVVAPVGGVGPPGVAVEGELVPCD